MSPAYETVVALLTPEGRGALATISVEGPQSIALVEPLFQSANRRPLNEQAIGAVLFGRWKSSIAGEEIVVSRRADGRVELHCHGGQFASRQILADLQAGGATIIDWPAWVARREADPLAAAARVALANAPTERIAQILCDQYRGALRNVLNAIATDAIANRYGEALDQLDELLQYSVLAGRLLAPWQIVVAGDPNVGKSSLINALLGYKRSIVHDQAGTTRDLVSTAAAIDGWPVELVDTAGMRSSDNPIEQAGVALAQAKLASADLVVWVHDLSRQATDAVVPHGALEVGSKCDLLVSAQRLAGHDWLHTSAKTGEGLEMLSERIARRLVPTVPPPGGPVAFTTEQVAALVAARTALAKGDVSLAVERLQTPPLGRSRAS